MYKQDYEWASKLMQLEMVGNFQQFVHGSKSTWRIYALIGVGRSHREDIVTGHFIWNDCTSEAMSERYI